MRDDDAQHAYEKIQKELARQAQAEKERRAQASDSRAAFLKRLISDVADSKANSPISKQPTEDKGTLTIVQTDGHFTIGEDDRLRPSTPEPDEGVPDDSYKARYEEAMELVSDLLFFSASTEDDLDESRARYEKLRDSDE